MQGEGASIRVIDLTERYVMTKPKNSTCLWLAPVGSGQVGNVPYSEEAPC